MKKKRNKVQKKQKKTPGEASADADDGRHVGRAELLQSGRRRAAAAGAAQGVEEAVGVLRRTGLVQGALCQLVDGQMAEGFPDVKTKMDGEKIDQKKIEN